LGHVAVGPSLTDQEENIMNHAAERAGTSHRAPAESRLSIAPGGAATTFVDRLDQLGDSPRSLRALLSLPKPIRGREWMAIGVGDVESPERLSDDDVRALISERLSKADGGASAQDVRALSRFQVVSVLFLAEKSGGTEDDFPGLVRRIRHALATDHELPRNRAIEVGGIVIDREALRATVSGKPIPLTALEFRLLLTLAERADRVQSRTTLLNDVWELSTQLNTRTVDTHIKRLRDKLGSAGKAIETVRSVGYRFNGRAPALARERDQGEEDARRRE
jgi:DNA-binding winged helix-turn-helix (wHTH) protein